MEDESADPTVEFRIGDLKGAGDWRMFDGIATVLVQGPADEHVYAVTEMVEEAVAEMKRRLVALEQSGATDGVTRDMARSGNCGACDRCGTGKDPIVRAGGYWVHRSHTQDPGSGFYRSTNTEGGGIAGWR